MKIQEMVDSYHESSGKVSDLARQLAFAGIAVIWVLRVGDDPGGLPFSEKLFFPLYLFALALVLDFLQYLYKTALWGSLNRKYWKRHQSNEVDVSISGLVNWPTHGFFWGKIFAVTLGFAELIAFIYSHL